MERKKQFAQRLNCLVASRQLFQSLVIGEADDKSRTQIELSHIDFCMHSKSARVKHGPGLHCLTYVGVSFLVDPKKWISAFKKGNPPEATIRMYVFPFGCLSKPQTMGYPEKDRPIFVPVLGKSRSFPFGPLF